MHAKLCARKKRDRSLVYMISMDRSFRLVDIFGDWVLLGESSYKGTQIVYKIFNLTFGNVCNVFLLGWDAACHLQKAKHHYMYLHSTVQI
jgi:hypothetical protein